MGERWLSSVLEVVSVNIRNSRGSYDRARIKAYDDNLQARRRGEWLHAYKCRMCVADADSETAFLFYMLFDFEGLNLV